MRREALKGDMFPLRLAAAALLAALCGKGFAAAPPDWADEFDAADSWKLIASDGTRASLIVSPDAPGALRLQYEFTGGGFCVLRRDVDLPLGENYRFTLRLRGAGPPNNLEFKLIDPSGENVWWLNRRAFAPPAEWTDLRTRARQFQFAWGPKPGEKLARLSAIEIAVAAAEGGAGCIDFDRVEFERLPPATSASALPRVFLTDADGRERDAGVLPEDGRLESAASGASLVRLDLGAVREIGGLAIEWSDENRPQSIDVQTSADGATWGTAFSATRTPPERAWIALPDAEARQVRVTFGAAASGGAAEVTRLRVLDTELGASQNRMFERIARESPRGRYPRYFLGEQQYWTVLGVAADRREALMDEAGAIELDRGGARLEPFVLLDGRLLTWADAEISQRLVENDLPTPIVTWRAGPLELEIRAMVDGAPDASRVIARYQLRNTGAASCSARLMLALRPFQVLPPWQELNLTGGVAAVESIVQNDQLILCGSSPVMPWTRFAKFAACASDEGEIVEHLALGRLPQGQGADDRRRLASAAIEFPFELGPGESHSAFVTIPLSRLSESDPCGMSEAAAENRFDLRWAAAQRAWRSELDGAKLRLPPGAVRIENTFRTMQAYILINADGPAIQPGSRTYERSWIRDGVLTSAALLYTDRAERVREFADWYGGFQFDSGKIPCVVDRRGADPVPEHDSTGEYMHLVWLCYRFTGEREFLERHWPRVMRGAAYLRSLRAQRLTAEFVEGPPEKRVLAGLLPESISHEGYSAKPMHSYWDDFWAIRGLDSAARIASELGHGAEAAELASLRDDLRESTRASIALAMRSNGIEYIPGCAELGDFDATSTATAVFPCGELAHLSPDALRATIDRYMRFFRDRRDGRAEWRDYTPYELRLVSTLVRMDRPAEARELLEYFLTDQRPAGWNQWAEVVWREARAPRFIGDMPHTWVGAEFICGVRSLFVYERERDDALVIGAGVSVAWLAAKDGVAIENWPTEYGAASWTGRATAGRLEFSLHMTGRTPPGGYVLRVPQTARPIRTALVDGQERPVGESGELLLRSADCKVEFPLGP